MGKQLSLRIRIALALLAFLTSLANAMHAQAIEPGAALSATIDLKLLEKLPPLEGKVSYIDFWASWCGPCQLSLPWLNELQQKLPKEQFQVIAVNLDTDGEAAKELLRKLGPRYFELILDPDGGLAKAFKLTSMPSSFIVDRTGTVVFAKSGFRSEDVPRIERTIVETLNAGAV